MILDDIINKTLLRINNKKSRKPLEDIKKEALNIEINDYFPFEKVLKHNRKAKDITIIAEVKRASPSKGIISEDFDYLNTGKEYYKIGVSAISVLTEPDFFKGQDKYLKEISSTVPIPILRKDFIIDEYMIYEAKTLGADIILLICSILDDKQLKKYIDLADSLGMSVLVETHNKEEVEKALRCGARIIGVNNRNLKDFTVDLNNSIKLREFVPEDVYFISESGIKTNEDILKLRNHNIDGVLIGETLMKSKNKKDCIEELKKV